MEVELECRGRNMSVMNEGWKPGLRSPEVDRQPTNSARHRPVRALKSLAGPFVVGAARLIAPLIRRYARDPRYGDAVANAVAGMLPELAIDRYFDLWQRHGVHLIPKDFDWPIPDTATLPSSLWDRHLEAPGLDLNPAAQLDLLTRVCLKYKPEYDEFPLVPTSDPCQYHIDNGLYESVDGEVLAAWARQRMANYKVPRKVEFVDALPRSGTGKIQWRALQDREFGRT